MVANPMKAAPDHLISVSEASRRLGLRRTDVQHIVQSGQLATFEGLIRIGDLRACFPDFDSSATLEENRFNHIRDNARRGPRPDRPDRPDTANPAALIRELSRLRRDNALLQATLQRQAALAQRRATLIKHTQEKLHDLQQRCPQPEAQCLHDLSSWLTAQAAERRR